MVPAYSYYNFSGLTPASLGNGITQVALVNPETAFIVREAELLARIPLLMSLLSFLHSTRGPLQSVPSVVNWEPLTWAVVVCEGYGTNIWLLDRNRQEQEQVQLMRLHPTTPYLCQGLIAIISRDQLRRNPALAPSILSIS